MFRKVMKMKRKRLIKKVMIACILFISILSFPSFAKADTIQSITPTGYTHTGTYSDGLGNSMWYTKQSIDTIRINGEVAFCVQPYKLVTDLGNYRPNALTNDLLSKIVFHGYWETGRSNLDSAITQIAIWVALGQSPQDTSIPDWRNKVQAIMDKVNRHDIKPSFHNSTIILNKGESKTIIDTNGVFSSLQLVNNTSNVVVKKNGNQLEIKAISDEVKNGYIDFFKTKDSAIIGASIVYQHPNSQNVAVLKLRDPLACALNIKITNGNLKINKIGEIFTHTLTGNSEVGTYEEPQWEKQKLLGAFFTILATRDIYDHSGNVLFHKNEVVDVIETTYDNNISIDLPEGDYVVYESKTPFGYLANYNKFYFSVSADGGSSQSFNYDVENERPSEIFVFNKLMEKHNINKYQNVNAYKNVVFGLYARENVYDYKGNVAIPFNTMVGQFIIDNKGNAKMAREWIDTNQDGIEQEEEFVYTDLLLNLPIGRYFMKELATDSMYELDTKEYEFEVAYMGEDFQNITLIVNDGKPIVNELKECTLQIIKVNGKDIKLANAKFGIYTNSACTELLKEVTSNEKGIAELKGLHYGDYWIKELSAPDKHIKSNEIFHFVFDDYTKLENGIFKIKYVNHQIIDTGDKTNLTKFLGLIGLSSIVLCGLYAFRKKKDFK